jgi:alkylhydroperoxidase family enzyme
MFERMDKSGSNLNIFRALSHSPEALRRFMKFGTYFLAEGKLDPKLREIAILRAGYVCRASYEVSQHIAFGRRAGLSDEQIRAIQTTDASMFDEREGCVLAFADELSRESRVSDATWERVAAFFNEEELVELTMVTSAYNMVSRMLNALEVDLDPPAAKDMSELGLSV